MWKITSSGYAYSSVIHLVIVDTEGAVRRLASADAEYSFVDQDGDIQEYTPELVLGKLAVEVTVDARTAILTISFDNGSCLRIGPEQVEDSLTANLKAGAADDPPYWELLSPQVRAFAFGPGWRWRVGFASDPVT